MNPSLPIQLWKMRRMKMKRWANWASFDWYWSTDRSILLLETDFTRLSRNSFLRCTLCYGFFHFFHSYLRFEKHTLIFLRLRSQRNPFQSSQSSLHLLQSLSSLAAQRFSSWALAEPPCGNATVVASWSVMAPSTCGAPSGSAWRGRGHDPTAGGWMRGSVRHMPDLWRVRLRRESHLQKPVTNQLHLVRRVKWSDVEGRAYECTLAGGRCKLWKRTPMLGCGLFSPEDLGYKHSRSMILEHWMFIKVSWFWDVLSCLRGKRDEIMAGSLPRGAARLRVACGGGGVAAGHVARVASLLKDVTRHVECVTIGRENSVVYLNSFIELWFSATCLEVSGWEPKLMKIAASLATWLIQSAQEKVGQVVVVVHGIGEKFAQRLGWCLGREGYL